MRHRIMIVIAAALMTAGFMTYTAPAQAAADPVVPGVEVPALSTAKPAGKKALKGNPDQARTMMTACGSPCYSYAIKRQHYPATPADGVAINATIYKPTKLTTDPHTLWEITVESDDDQQIVEVGWTVDTLVCGSVANSPCLFTFAWVNGVAKCYNGCDFVPAIGCAPYCMGSPVTSLVGTTKGFAIQHISGAWWVAFDGVWRGAWPDSVWTGATPAATFTQSQYTQSFGEVAAGNDPTQTDMGNGVLAVSTSLGALASGYQLVNSTGTASWASTVTTAADRWTVTDVSTTSFRYGGPGGNENLPIVSPTCSGVGITPTWGGYGSYCPYANTSGGVPVTKIADWDPGAANVCVPNQGTADGIYTTPIRVFENTMYTQFIWYRDANCAGSGIWIDYDKTVLPAGWTALAHASRKRVSTPVVNH
jgi:hypothetical protein